MLKKTLAVLFFWVAYSSDKKTLNIRDLFFAILEPIKDAEL
jgi:hypothetical protein